jgi:hypothetical protein
MRALHDDCVFRSLRTFCHSPMLAPVLATVDAFRNEHVRVHDRQPPDCACIRIGLRDRTAGVAYCYEPIKSELPDAR